jgi:hypothetical protein
MSVSCNCEKCLVVIPFLIHLIIYKKYFINFQFETNEMIKETWLMIKWEGMCFDFWQTIVHVGDDEN